MMKIHETTMASGALAATHLRVSDGEIELVADDGAFVLPEGAIAAVMKRYGAPVEHGISFSEVDAIDLGRFGRLRHVRHLARFDVVAKDWLVYESHLEEPLCALANTVARALDHLARAAARTPETGS